MVLFYSLLGILHVFLYMIYHQYLPLPVYEVPAIRVNTSKSTYTLTSVLYLCGEQNKPLKAKTIITRWQFPRQPCQYENTYPAAVPINSYSLDRNRTVSLGHL